MKKFYIMFILFSLSISLLAGCNSNTPSTTSPQPTEQNTAIEDSTPIPDIVITTISKTETLQNIDQWIFSDYINCIFLLTNNTDKEIKGVEGILTINDVFGKEIKKLKCDFTGFTIPANGEAYSPELSYECNEFINEDVTLLNSSFEDLEFVYNAKQIVFTDGSNKILE